jgi:hypothetical protein
LSGLKTIKEENGKSTIYDRERENFSRLQNDLGSLKTILYNEDVCMKSPK